MLEIDLPLLAPADRGRGRDRVPVHVHVVRRRAAPRRAAPLDARGRDLPPDRRAARPPGRRRARARAARRGRRAAARHHADAVSGSQCNDACAAATRRPSRCARAAERALLGANFAVMLVLLGLPLLALVERSFAVPGGHGLTWYRQLGSTGTSGLFVPPTEAIRNSLVFAVIATVIATVIGGLASIAIGGRHARALVRRRPDAAARHVGRDDRLRLPRHARPAAARPARQRRSSSRSRRHSSPCRSSCARSCPCSRSIDDRLREAAAVLGASPSRTWREVDLPARARALAVGAGFAFAVSLGEFGATVFVARPDTPTLPDRDLPLARPPRRVELRPGDGDGDDPHGADRAVRARVRTRSPRRPRGVLSARRGARSRAVRRPTRPSTAST